MTFANPFAWALLALVVVPAVLYLLPMPRRRAEQPSLLLWQKMLSERPATQSWRWLRTLASFLLAAAIIVLLSLAAGKPVFGPASGEGKTAVIVVDTSASMKAPLSPGGAATRFDRAKEIATRLVTALPSGRRAAVVAADVTPRGVSGLSEHRDITLRKLKTLAASDSRGDLAAAARVALELAAGEANADVYIISDGGADLSDVALGGAKVQYLRVGESLPNVGIVACKARRAFEDPDAFEALVRVQNASDEKREVSLRVAVDDNTVETRTLTLAARAVASESFTGRIRGRGILTAALTPGDAFKLDDTARVTLGGAQKMQVVLVSDVPDRFIESALSANRGVESYLATLTKYMESRPQPDVLILSGVLPPELPPGNLLILNPPNATSLFQLGEPAATPKIVDWDRAHPVMADVTLQDVHVPSARVIKPTRDAVTLIEGPDGPLMVAFSSPERRVIVLGFDPGSSSLSFRVAFPVLVADAFNWLTRGSSGAAPVDANLADARESDLTVPAELAFADAKVSGRDARGGGLGEFWLLAAMGAVVLVSVEWYLYHHRVTV